MFTTYNNRTSWAPRLEATFLQAHRQYCEVTIQAWLQSLLFEPVLPAHSFRMKEANGCFRVKEAKVNSRDRYLLRALNPAQGIMKGEQHNSMNTSESHGPKDAIEILKINGNGCYWKLLGFLCDSRFAILGDPGRFQRGSFHHL